MRRLAPATVTAAFCAAGAMNGFVGPRYGILQNRAEQPAGTEGGDAPPSRDLRRRTMARSDDIVAHGGWVREEVIVHPKARAFALGAGVSLAVGMVTAVELWSRCSVGESETHWLATARFLGLPAAAWIAGTPLALSVFLAAIALAVRLREKPRSVTRMVGNPHVDPRNLY